MCHKGKKKWFDAQSTTKNRITPHGNGINATEVGT